jgi:hypothetical protein
MARICGSCKKHIEQAEVLEITVRALDPNEGQDQDNAAQVYEDFCDGCISDGSAIAFLLKAIEWTLEPKSS